MSDRFRLTLAQLNPTLGDLSGNAAKARAAWDRAKAEGADMVALPEMFLSGYQTQDLVQRPAFLADLRATLDDLARDCADGPMMGIGLPMAEGEAIHNCWVVLGGGEVRATIRKHHLPNEQVFDEQRVFGLGRHIRPIRGGAVAHRHAHLRRCVARRCRRSAGRIRRGTVAGAQWLSLCAGGVSTPA